MIRFPQHKHLPRSTPNSSVSISNYDNVEQICCKCCEGHTEICVFKLGHRNGMEVGSDPISRDVDNACWDSPSLYNSDTKRHFALAVTRARARACVCIQYIYQTYVVVLHQTAGLIYLYSEWLICSRCIIYGVFPPRPLPTL